MKEQIKRLPQIGALSQKEVLQAAGLHLLSLLCGFVASRASVIGGLAPFGLSVTAGMPSVYTISVGAGVLVGYFFPITGGSGFRYLAALFAIVAIKLLLQSVGRFSKSPVFSGLIALVVTILTAFVTHNNSLAEILTAGMEGVLAGGGAYFTHRTFARNRLKDKLLPSREDLVSMVIFCFLVLMGLYPIGIAELSLGRMLAVTAVLAAARFGQTGAGAVCGVTAGLSVALAGGDFTSATLLYAFGGLMAGLFSPVGKFASAAAFLAAAGISCLLAQNTVTILGLLLETVFGAAIFLLLPKSVNIYLGRLFSPPADLAEADGLRHALTMRLSFAAEALSDVSKTVEQVSEELGRINAPDFNTVLTRIEQDACRGCTLCTHCWETVKNSTVSAVLDMTKAVKQGEEQPESAAGEEFLGRCLRPARVGRAVQKHFADYAAHMAAENRIEEVRSVVSDQFEGISNMLCDLADEFEQAERFDTVLAAKVVTALSGMGIHATECACRTDRFGRMAVEVKVKQREGQVFNRIHIMRQVEAVCDRDFDPPCFTESDGAILITLSEKAVFTAETGVAQIACGNAAMCGDAYHYFTDGKGRMMLILSDGMGTGGRAAVDSAMASGLMSRLLKAGFGYDCSLRILNSSMLFKSTDESLATVDIACIDLFTGMTDLLKAGAAPTIVRRSGRTGKAQSTSLPAGILREVGFDKATIRLKAGDIVLMLSDGATSSGTEWICAELEAWQDGTAQQLADHIASCARRRRNDGHEDDITVLASILERAV